MTVGWCLKRAELMFKCIKGDNFLKFTFHLLCTFFWFIYPIFMQYMYRMVACYSIVPVRSAY
jgi:hypothetical protein